MKKLLTLILPALALTTGAPMADAADYYGALTNMHPDGTICSAPVYGYAVGKTSEGAATQEAIDKCVLAGGAPPGNADVIVACGDSMEIITTMPNGQKCVAYGQYQYAEGYSCAPRSMFGDKTATGSSKAEAIEKLKKKCRHCPGPPQVVVCADDGVTQVAAAPQPAPAADEEGTFGAFALDAETRDAGFSVWFPRQSTADERALSECASYGGRNCTIRRRFPHRCGALARAEQGDRWAWGFGYADSKAEAVDLALSECRGRGVSGCYLQSSACGAGADSAATPTPEQRKATIDAARQEAAQQAKQGLYGAFALDDAAWAFAYASGERTQGEADQAALSICARQGGKACVIKYQHTGSRCGAAAVAEERGLRAWGYGHADGRGDAIDNALGHCKRNNTSGAACNLASVSCGE